MKGSVTGSLRYDMSGRKRKTKALNTAKKYKPAFKVLKPRKSIPGYDDQKVYESVPITPMNEDHSEDKSYQQEVSKNYTVSIAYNKGAYQVVPNSDLKHIGK
tara:strand:+ start:46 stop:351 length:306 start_codon:yes stop_codon:yes gene_type:complete